VPHLENTQHNLYHTRRSAQVCIGDVAIEEGCSGKVFGYMLYKYLGLVVRYPILVRVSILSFVWLDIS
jgi:hypothetical protein